MTLLEIYRSGKLIGGSGRIWSPPGVALPEQAEANLISLHVLEAFDARGVSDCERVREIIEALTWMLELYRQGSDGERDAETEAGL